MYIYIFHREGKPFLLTVKTWATLSTFCRSSVIMGCVTGTIYFKDFIYLFILERGREGEREGEKHQHAVAYRTPPTGDLVRKPDICPHWESNHRPFDCRSALKPMSHTSQGNFNCDYSKHKSPNIPETSLFPFFPTFLSSFFCFFFSSFLFCLC